MKRTFMRVLLALTALALLATATGCTSKPEGGQIGVHRADGPFEGNKIKGVICPQAGATTVWNDEVHYYPDSSSQRTFKFNNDGDADAKAIENLRTKDGVKVTLSGTVFFKTAFDCNSEQGKELLKAFDQANVNRPEGQRPWEDWEAWLANQWKPILDRNARDVVLGIECKQIVSSCALLARDTQSIDLDETNNQSNVQKIERALAEGLNEQLREKIGEGKYDFFTAINFNMEQPLLPEVDDAIAQAQKAYAKVADVRAERLKQVEQVKVERQKKQVARQKQKGYQVCPSCARQDEYRALPDGLQVLGGNPATVLG